MTRTKQSAGILLYRRRESSVELLLVHPGGPYWAKKDLSAWSIPKGEFSDDEDALEAAKREFAEEIGSSIEGDFVSLGKITQPSGKVVYAWAVQGDCDPARVISNTFSMEWPPKSGTMQEFPEIDRAAWFSPLTAKKKLHKGQVPFVDLLLGKLNIAIDETSEGNSDQDISRQSTSIQQTLF